MAVTRFRASNAPAGLSATGILEWAVQQATNHYEDNPNAADLYVSDASDQFVFTARTVGGHAFPGFTAGLPIGTRQAVAVWDVNVTMLTTLQFQGYHHVRIEMPAGTVYKHRIDTVVFDSYGSHHMSMVGTGTSAQFVDTRGGYQERPEWTVNKAIWDMRTHLNGGSGDGLENAKWMDFGRKEQYWVVANIYFLSSNDCTGDFGATPTSWKQNTSLFTPRIPNNIPAASKGPVTNILFHDLDMDGQYSGYGGWQISCIEKYAIVNIRTIGGTPLRHESDGGVGTGIHNGYEYNIYGEGLNALQTISPSTDPTQPHSDILMDSNLVWGCAEAFRSNRPNGLAGQGISPGTCKLLNCFAYGANLAALQESSPCRTNQSRNVYALGVSGFSANDIIGLKYNGTFGNVQTKAVKDTSIATKADMLARWQSQYYDFGDVAPPPPPPPPPPDPVVNSGPAATTTSTDATFNVTDTEAGAQIQYRIDPATGDPWIDMPSNPFTVTGLAAGSHQAQFRATNVNGASGTVAYSWEVTVNPSGGGEGRYDKTLSVPGAPGTTVPVTITIRATDANPSSPRTTTVQRHVNVTIPSVSGPPTVIVVTPADNTTIEGSDLLVQADVTVPSGTVQSVTTKVGSDPQQPLPYSGSGDRYSGVITIPITSAPTRVVVRGTGSDGQFDTAAFNVTAVPEVVDPNPNPDPGPSPSGTLLRSAFVPAPVVGQKANFVVQHYDTHDKPLGEIMGDDFRFGKYLNQAGYVSYQIPRTHYLANPSLTFPFLTDFKLWRDDQNLIEGEIRSLQRDTDDPYLIVGGKDYLEYMNDIRMHFDPANPVNFIRRDKDLTEIVEGLIDFVTGQFPTALTYDHQNMLTGIVQTTALLASDLSSLFEMIQTLSEQAQGFDFDIGPGREFRMYAPEKRLESPLVLDRSNIKQFHFDPSVVTPLTRMYGTGSGSGSTRALRVAIDPQFDASLRHRSGTTDFGTIRTPNQLTGLTKHALSENNRTIEFVVTAIPSPGENYWILAEPGSIIHLDWQEPDLPPITGTFRCVAMEGYVNNQGDEQIVFNFDATAVYDYAS